jgi:hypothetical protein
MVAAVITGCAVTPSVTSPFIAQPFGNHLAHMLKSDEAIRLIPIKTSVKVTLGPNNRRGRPHLEAPLLQSSEKRQRIRIFLSGDGLETQIEAVLGAHFSTAPPIEISNGTQVFLRLWPPKDIVSVSAEAGS